MEAIQAHRITTPGSKSALDEWKPLLQKHTGRDGWNAITVSEYLIEADEQATKLQKQLKSRGILPRGYKHAIHQVKSALSIGNFSNPWASVTHALDELTFVSLVWSSAVLEKVESQISDEDLSEMTDLIRELETLLGQDDVPLELKTAIEKHLEGIKRSINLYSIGGVEKIRESLERSVGALHSDVEVLKEAVDSGDKTQTTVLKKLVSFIDRTTAAANKATNTAKSIVGLGNAITDLTKLLGP